MQGSAPCDGTLTPSAKVECAPAGEARGLPVDPAEVVCRGEAGAERVERLNSIGVVSSLVERVGSLVPAEART